MIKDLPDISDIFSNDPKQDNIKKKDNKELKEDGLSDEIMIYVSRGNNKWVKANFIDVAPSNIGIHVLLPFEMDLNYGDLSNFRIKFEEWKNDSLVIMKEISGSYSMAGEKEQISGRVKLGLHFPGESKNEPDMIKILDRLKNKK